MGDIWSAVGVIGGAVYATYSTITSLSIKAAIASLRIDFLEKISEINTQAAIQSTEISNLERRIERLELGIETRINKLEERARCLYPLVHFPNEERRP
jgi:hypothetical protein